MTNLHYRVWDGEQMHYWDDEGISLTIKNDGSWFLWHYADGCVVSSDDKDAVLMWGTGVKDDEWKMIYPGDAVEYETRNLVQAFGGDGPEYLLERRIICSFGGKHNVPCGFLGNLKVIGNEYENPGLLKEAE
ncbi:YopX family protein [Bacillus sonorensis]|uniref:YopX family protein n=1 Tax=Bacillus sonorensis TaxID=119858 RepID=UPI002DBD05E0|nr:YopX family protein [Bacillus sonorensis]MEC1428841.1 YopX family protein [Bacillus sonorensis]